VYVALRAYGFAAFFTLRALFSGGDGMEKKKMGGSPEGKETRLQT
jgi:hypothetical protein